MIVLERISFTCSFTTILLGLFMALTDRNYLKKISLVILLIINVVFVIGMLIKILKAYIEDFEIKL